MLKFIPIGVTRVAVIACAAAFGAAPTGTARFTSIEDCRTKAVAIGGQTKYYLELVSDLEKTPNFFRPPSWTDTVTALAGEQRAERVVNDPKTSFNKCSDVYDAMVGQRDSIASGLRDGLYIARDKNKKGACKASPQPFYCGNLNALMSIISASATGGTEERWINGTVGEALANAGYSANLAIIQSLIRGGAAVDGTDTHGATALWMAAWNAHPGRDGAGSGGDYLETIRFLANNGANVNAAVPSSGTVLSVAKKSLEQAKTRYSTNTSFPANMQLAVDLLVAKGAKEN